MVKIRINPPLDRNEYPDLYKQFHELVMFRNIEPTVYLVVNPDTNERYFEVVVDQHSQSIRRGC